MLKNLLVVGIFAIMLPMTSGETLFFMDFESDSVNPSDSLGGQWLDQNVYNKHSESSGQIPTIFQFGGTQGNVARAVSSTGGSGRSEWFRGGLNLLAGHPKFVLEADILYNASGNFAQGVRHDGRVFGFGAQIFIAPDEEIIIRQTRSSSNFTFTGVTLSKGVFHKTRFEYDNLNVTVFVDGISLGTYQQDAVPDSFISGNSPDRAPGDYMVDNVHIFTEDAVPEPSSLLLLLVGAAVVIPRTLLCHR